MKVNNSKHGNNNPSLYKQRLLELLDALLEGETGRSMLRNELSKCCLRIIEVSRQSNPEEGVIENGIVHAQLSLVMCKYMIQNGFNVQSEKVEERTGLRPDIFYRKGRISGVIEVENTNVPSGVIQKKGISPETWEKGRTIGKIVRYSPVAEELYLGFSATPSINHSELDPVLRYFMKPKSERNPAYVDNCLGWTGKIYTNPLLKRQDLERAKLSGVYEISIGNMRVRPMKI